MFGIYEAGKGVIAKFTAPMSVKSNQPIFASDTLSLKRQTVKRPAQRWEISSNLEPLSFNAQDLFVSLVSKGESEEVLVLMPQNFGAMKRSILNSGTPVATGNKHSSNVNVSGFTGLISKGSFIKFANHNKIYIATADRSGAGTLHIYPHLQADTTNAIVYFRNDIIASFLYDLDTVKGMAYSDGILMDMGEVKLLEKL